LIILGVNAGRHDGAAALVVDGRLRRVVEAERITRLKRSLRRSPAPAIQACLAAEGLALESVDLVASGWDFPAYPEWSGEEYTVGEREAFYEWLLDSDGTVEEVYGSKRRREPREPAPTGRPPLVFVRHHDAHAYSALLVSGGLDASVIVADGRGELASTSIGVARAGELEWTSTWPLHQSLGHFYGIASEWTGMDYWDGGKLMGLASYGTPNQSLPVSVGEHGYCIDISGTDGVGPNQQHALMGAQLPHHFAARNYPYHKGTGRDIMAYANFAATVQQVVENSMAALYRLLERAGGSDRLIIAGGVGMNCSMIGKLTRMPGVPEVFVPSFTYDAGVSIGAALAVARRCGEPVGQGPRLRSAYFGLGYSTAQIEQALEGRGLVCERLAEDELLDRAAGLLDDDWLLGWFQGRAEVGQRALGNRSIVANPRHRQNHVRVNDLKGRELWRPLAPSVLEERIADLFEVGGARSPYDFMLAAAPVRPEAAALIPATVHVDGTARPQAVSRDTNPRYWGLIERFRQRSGVPCVMNTSFNLAGSPIVNSPEDAVDTFVKSALDALVIGDYLVTKRPSGMAMNSDTSP